MTLLELTIEVALAAAFVVLLMKKWGIVEYMQIYGNNFFSKLFSCEFCLSFWTCLVIACITAALTGEFALMAAPLFSTPITRMIV